MSEPKQLKGILPLLHWASNQGPSVNLRSMSTFQPVSTDWRTNFNKVLGSNSIKYNPNIKLTLKFGATVIPIIEISHKL